MSDFLSDSDPVTRRTLRGDATVEFRWRANGIGMDSTDPAVVEDGMRGVQAWHAASYWSGEYRDWRGEQAHGGNLLFRGGTPNARAVRCLSEVVPPELAARAVTFAIPLHIGLGTGERLSVALKVAGQGEEIVVLNLEPRREIHSSSGRFKAVFHLLRVDDTPADGPRPGFSGLLHIRVYPLLLNSGGRMTVEFHSQTAHMDREASLFVGSLWRDLSATDPREEWARSGLDEAKLAETRADVRRRLDAWNEQARELSRRLLSTDGRVEVSLSSRPRPWDRGELRVQAYTGNPAKDVVAGEPNHHCVRMAESLTAAIGHRFSLFRYLQWQPVVKENNPRELEPQGWAMLEQWLIAAERSAEQVMLAFYLDAFLAAYLRTTRRGTVPLPPEGVPGHTWEHLRTGYGLYGFVTTDNDSVRALLWTASPSIFLQEALPLRYPKAELILRDLPAAFRDRTLHVTIHTSDPDDPALQAILALPKCQTLPITRGAGERYEIDFTPEEVAVLNAIPARDLDLTAQDGVLRVPIEVGEHCMVLVIVQV